MVSEEVQYIKKNQKHLIERTISSSYGIIFGYRQHIKYDACLARLNKRISEQNRGGKVKSSMQYILKYEVDSRLFAYKTLIKELNKIFGKYFKITMHTSGRSAAKILHIKEVRKLPNLSLKYAGYYMILVLLRAIDGEFHNSWKRAYKGKKITTWYDIVYHYYKTVGIWGHGINDSVAELGQQTKRRKTDGNEILYKSAIENYLEVLEIAFGSDFDYKAVKNTQSISYANYRTRGQTPTFKYVENIIRQGGRNE